MKNRTDKVLLLKIQRYLTHLAAVYDVIKDMSDVELEDELLAYSAAQLITNLKESYDMLESEEMHERYKLLRKPSIVKIRNIASHDYESLNWSIVKSGCKALIQAYHSKTYHDDSLAILDAQKDSSLVDELSVALDMPEN